MLKVFHVQRRVSSLHDRDIHSIYKPIGQQAIEAKHVLLSHYGSALSRSTLRGNAEN